MLEVRAIGAGGVTLRNAAGREGQVAWDTLRDRQSGRIRLSYGDVLTIDATQGLTSTEHIEAMPAGTQAVNAYKAYTAASRHRRATFMVVAEGAERREITGRRPLGDARPIRETDVWANIGRNLSRQPEQESALAFLERAHGVRRRATAALQAGLQPTEQRREEGRAPTTIAPRLERGRVAAKVGAMAGELMAWTDQQEAALDKLDRVAPAVRQAVARTVQRLRPAIESAAERIRQRPGRVRRRRQEAELAAGRERLLRWHMKLWWAETRWGYRTPSNAVEAQWKQKAAVEEARQRVAIAAMPDADMRRSDLLQRWLAWKEQKAAKIASPAQGPRPSMSPGG